MKRSKAHRKPGVPKINYNSNNKIKKAVAKRTRKYVASNDPNKKWEDDNMTQTMVSSTATSRINSVSSRRNEILIKQREASQVLTQLDIQYNDLYRKSETIENSLEMILKLERK
jgi:4'-phosphopantetheinyl transferase EntD